MILRGHPSGTRLGAWFDGESVERVGSHVARCHRCQRRVSELGRLRSWLRAQPFVAMTDSPDPEPGRGSRTIWRPVVLVGVVVAGLLVAPDRSDTARTGRESAMETAADQTATSLAPSTTAAPDPVEPIVDQPLGDVPPPTAASRPPGQAPVAPVAPEPSATLGPSTVGPIRLGLIVPTTGPAAAEGAAVERIVRDRVAAANSAGGVGGRPVELVVVPAEDARRIEGLAGKVDALVGGFGATPPLGVPWLLPADPSVSGPDVVSLEAPPRVAGVELAQVLRREGLRGPIGVVVGPGPDSAMAAGLASRASVVTAASRGDGTCQGEILDLYRAGAVALAVAGAPDLAAQCLRAVARSPWRPRFGAMVAPSAAYSGLEAVPEALGARTLLALPWPTSLLPGAARFRASSDSTSYRAMVSYAATELAMDVARQRGDLTLESIASGNWRSDMFDLVGTTTRTMTLVTAFLGTWLPSL